MMMITPLMVANANRVLRVAQLVACITAFITTLTSFGVTYSNGFSYRLGSPATSLHVLGTYTALLYTGWWVVCVELLGLAPRPRLPMMRLLDSVHALVLLVAAGVFRRSDYVAHCENYGFMLTCSGFDSAIVSTVVAMVCLTASIGLTFVPCTVPNGLHMPPVGYMVETTPTTTRPTVLSPQAAGPNVPTPSTKV